MLFLSFHLSRTDCDWEHKLLIAVNDSYSQNADDFSKTGSLFGDLALSRLDIHRVSHDNNYMKDL